MKKAIKLTASLVIFAMLFTMLIGCNDTVETVNAVFVGVADYNTTPRDKVLTSKKAVYQFEIDGKVKKLCINCPDGDYSIQNSLMMGYEYVIEIKGKTVISAEIVDKSALVGSVNGYTPGEKSLLNFLRTAVSPIGKVNYIYGGGWNFEDSGSGFTSRTIGLIPAWEAFYKSQNADYTIDSTDHENGWNALFYAGLDSSGYVGWVLYNVMNNKSNDGAGLVGVSTDTAKRLAEDCGFGTFVHPTETDYSEIVKTLLPGDVVSISGHVYFVVGTCDDGSVVVAQCAAATSATDVRGGGVQLAAFSANGDEDRECEAYKLAKKYTEKYYPEFYSRYPDPMKKVSMYLDFTTEAQTGVFSWSVGKTVSDNEGIRSMSAAEVLRAIYSETDDKYSVLVNKENKISSDFIDKIELIEIIDVYDETIEVEKTSYEAYLALHDALIAKGVEIGVDSAYRSVETQQRIMDEFTEKYGEEYAKKTVAIPGTSEHHTGLAIDIVVKVNGEWVVENEDMMKETAIFAVIHESLADYGFILRYPSGKEAVTGYSYEPWHIRYVGVDTAKAIYADGLTLEEYLAK